MRGLRQRWFQIPVSVLVWVLLWGELTAFLVVTGALLGVLVTLLFPLPPVPWSGRFRPVGFGVLVGTLLVDLVRGSITVGRLALRPPRPMRNAIVGVQLRSRSDLYLTLVSQLMSVVPGSSVIEVRRRQGMCYLHVMDVRAPENLERLREEVLAAEVRVIRAFGSADELARFADPAGASR